MTTLYGIPNCDTVRKARHWLDSNGIDYRFHDLRRDGLERGQLQAWVQALGWERLLNRRGTTWRQLPADVRDTLTGTSAIHIMLQHPAIIRRPVLEHAGRLEAGFDATTWQELFA